MEQFAAALKALGHTDRLRILVLLSQGELTVSELVQILNLSQPRVTQYIKSLEQAGLIERLREGSWVFSRLRRSNAALSALVATTLATLPQDDLVLTTDRKRLQDVRRQRSEQASAFFAEVANDRSQLGSEYLPQAHIEDAILKVAGDGPFKMMIDLGTGTGRMLELFAGHTAQGIGVDRSVDMLKVARHKLLADEYAHLFVQQADLHATPLEAGVADIVTIHQVLHYLDDPHEALREASRLLAPGGQLIIVDFAAHQNDSFREEYAHRRLGFSNEDMSDLFAEFDVNLSHIEDVPAKKAGMPSVKIWQGHKNTAENALEQRR